MPEPITHRHKLLLLGSCFTENIGEKLRKHKFTVMENPNGILFNPVSVTEAIVSYLENARATEQDLFYYNEAYHSWKHHSRFSGITADEALEKINTSTQAAHNFIKETDFLLVTLGSSWVYTLTDKALNAKPGSVAANNHKAPADWFYRRLMTVEELQGALDTMLHRLFNFNRHVKIIFTISPVRHLREGVIENNRSKALLIQAVHQLVEKFDRLYYFPAYELVIDDLRDYRFYAEDMVHPNYHATQYVWEKFVQACIGEDSQKLIDEIAGINLAYQHKPFNPASAQHRKFLQASLHKTQVLQQQHTYLNFEQELQYFGSGQKQD